MRSSAMKGTCRALSRLPFEACGKTGTAQNHGRDHSVFMCFAPMNNPKIAIDPFDDNDKAVFTDKGYKTISQDEFCVELIK